VDGFRSLVGSRWFEKIASWRDFHARAHEGTGGAHSHNRAGKDEGPA